MKNIDDLTILEVIIGVIGLILAYIFWAFSPNIEVPLGIVLPIIIILIIIILLIFIIYYNTKANVNTIPQVISGRPLYKDEIDSPLLCILDPSKLFYQDMLVSIYFIDNFEELLGIGNVINIQVDKKIQVVMNYHHERHKKIIDELKSNNATTIKKTIVKPYVPKREFEKLNNIYLEGEI